MEKIAEYLEATNLKIVTSPIVSVSEISKERITDTDGYIRVRMTLVNGDYLELSEYFERPLGGIKTVDYILPPQRKPPLSSVRMNLHLSPAKKASAFKREDEFA